MQELNKIGEELELLRVLDDPDASFGRFTSGSDLELSTNSHLHINVKEFNIDDYIQMAERIRSG
jgi:hypothetical protein